MRRKADWTDYDLLMFIVKHYCNSALKIYVYCNIQYMHMHALAIATSRDPNLLTLLVNPIATFSKHA